MNTLGEFASYIDANRDRVLSNLDPESIDVYVFLSKRFEDCDASTDRVFQFAFRSFYRLDSAGLTNVFKAEYFKTLQTLRGTDAIDLRALAHKFHRFPRLKGDNSLQFSFITKLAHTISAAYPIYDDEVANAFAFAKPNYGTFEVRLDKFMVFYEWLRSAYPTILAAGMMAKTIQAFRARFSDQVQNMEEVKVLDFIFWSAGKLIRTRQVTNAPNRVSEPTRPRRRAAQHAR